MRCTESNLRLISQKISQAEQQVGAGHPPVDHQEPALRFKLNIRQVGHVDEVRKQVCDMRFRLTLFWNDKSHHDLPKCKLQLKMQGMY